VILSTAVPAGSPAVVTWYTQVLPTAAGKSGVPVKEPGDAPVPAPPAADEDAGDAGADEADEADGEPEPQPARASPVRASSAAPPADRREVELRRFMGSSCLSWYFGVGGEASKYPSGGALAWCPSVDAAGPARTASYAIDAARPPLRSAVFASCPIEIYRGWHCRR
jgi:hypothetical protein